MIFTVSSIAAVSVKQNEMLFPIAIATALKVKFY